MITEVRALVHKYNAFNTRVVIWKNARVTVLRQDSDRVFVRSPFGAAWLEEGEYQVIEQNDVKHNAR